MEKMEDCLLMKILEKYNFFMSDIKVNISKNQNTKRVYFDPEITVTTPMVPNEYYDMKNDVYKIISEETKLIPVLRGGWKINWLCYQKDENLTQKSSK